MIAWRMAEASGGAILAVLSELTDYSSQRSRMSSSITGRTLTGNAVVSSTGIREDELSSSSREASAMTPENS